MTKKRNIVPIANLGVNLARLGWAIWEWFNNR